MAKSVQNEYYPDYVTPPGETLADALNALSISQSDLSERIGKHKKTINEIVKNKQKITPDTALELELALGIPASFWINRQARFDEFAARRARVEAILSDKNDYNAWCKQFPASQLAARGWIPAKHPRLGHAANLLTYFGVASSEQWKSVYSARRANYRSAVRLDSLHFGLVTSWLRKGEIDASKVVAPPFSEDLMKQSLGDIRRLSRLAPLDYLPGLSERCLEFGLVVVYTPSLPGLRVYGSCRWTSGGRPIVQLSSLRRTDDHFWFTLFHEFCHVLHHPRKSIFIDGEDESDDIEAQANRFAEDQLIPRNDWRSFLETFEAVRLRRSEEKTPLIQVFAKKLGIAPGIVVGRLQREGIIPFSHCNSLKKSIVL